MTGKLLVARPKEVARVIERVGFELIRQRGSHAIYRHEDGRWTTIPMHRKTLGKGLPRSILRDVGLSVEEFNELR